MMGDLRLDDLPLRAWARVAPRTLIAKGAGGRWMTLPSSMRLVEGVQRLGCLLKRKMLHAGAANRELVVKGQRA